MSGSSVELPDDEELVSLAREGDRSAFAELLGRHGREVFGLAFRLTHSYELASDVAQETWIRAWRGLPAFRGEAAFATWVYRIAVNTCYDLLRKERRRPSEAMPDYLDLSDPRAEDPYTSVELRPSVEAALATLSPDFRAVVVLSDIEGMSLPEVAEALEVPVGTVKSRLFRARRQLAGVMGNLSDGSEHQTGTEP